MSSEKKETKQVYKTKRVKVLGTILALLMILDWFAPRHHAHFFWDSIPGFSAVFGFIACTILVFFSKGIGHAFLMKREDYYDD
ncbi:MAG: hypothetical protein ABGX83_03620 [Nitrospira sp.]|nr:hypothetical protein [Candidatus Manganitrophaceae bacterium]HIL34253.1 hypothetical protein [Candidatus Manganitrophaceae bacterium]